MYDTDQQLTDQGDEIVIREENGSFKVFKNGVISALPTAPVSTPEELKPSNEMMTTAQTSPALQPPVPAVIKKNASFYFFPEDEEEVSKIKPLVNNLPQKKYSLDKIVLKIIDDQKLNLTADLKLRLRNAVYSFLRDRRALLDTKELLVRSITNGGLALAKELAEAIAGYLKKIKEKIDLEKGLVVDEQSVGLEGKPQAPKIPVRQPNTMPSNFKTISSPAPPIEPKVKPIASLKTFVRPQRTPQQGKVSMYDIQKDYKLVGPVEELGSMSLTTFRRLGNTARDQGQKVIDKVSRLGQDSLAKKAAGIQAWRKSPLYKMYLTIGQASMEHGVPVQTIINEYQAENKEILTMEEFEVVSDINKYLRF